MKTRRFLGALLAMVMAACSPTTNPGGTVVDDSGAGNGDTGAGAVDTGTGTDGQNATGNDAGGGAMDGCTATVARGGENTDALCSNGMDDDCNGYTDCDDHACTRASVTVCGTATDGGSVRDTGTTRRDGSTSRADAAGCVRMGYEDTAAACSDGIDNDCNGYTDCADRNCSCVGACAGWAHGCTCHGTERSNATCMDGVDNNCNGYTDCADFGCSHNSHVTVCASDGGTPPADGG